MIIKKILALYKMKICPICLDEIVCNIHVTFCFHIFHHNCICKSLVYDNKCPICRRFIQNTKSKKHMRVKKENPNGYRWTETVNADGIIISSVPIWI